MVGDRWHEFCPRVRNHLLIDRGQTSRHERGLLEDSIHADWGGAKAGRGRGPRSEARVRSETFAVGPVHPAQSGLAARGTCRLEPGEAHRDWRRRVFIGRRAGRSVSRASATSSSRVRNGARPVAPPPDPPLSARWAALARSSGSWHRPLVPAAPLGPGESGSSRATLRRARRPEGVAAPRAANFRAGEYFGTGDSGVGRRPSRASVSLYEQRGGWSQRPLCKFPRNRRAGSSPAPRRHGDPCLGGVFLGGEHP